MQEQDQGWFTNTKTTTTTNDSIHFKETHGVSEDEIEIFDASCVSTQDIEHELTACGMCVLVPLVKLSMELCKSGGRLDPELAMKIVRDAAIGSASIAVLVRTLGPETGMVMMGIIAIVPHLDRGDREAARRHVEKIGKGILISKSVGLATTSFVLCCLPGLTP